MDLVMSTFSVGALALISARVTGSTTVRGLGADEADEE